MPNNSYGNEYNARKNRRSFAPRSYDNYVNIYSTPTPSRTETPNFRRIVEDHVASGTNQSPLTVQRMNELFESLIQPPTEQQIEARRQNAEWEIR